MGYDSPFILLIPVLINRFISFTLLSCVCYCGRVGMDLLVQLWAARDMPWVCMLLVMFPSRLQSTCGPQLLKFPKLVNAASTREVYSCVEDVKNLSPGPVVEIAGDAACASNHQITPWSSLVLVRK